MRTNTTAPKKAATAKKTTTSASSGELKPGRITVTIDGELADELRKEAETTGMGPLSLVRQRIKLGSLVTGDTDEAKGFRMEIAEKAFHDAGKPLPESGNHSSGPPPECGTALVTKSDAGWIEKFAKDFESPPWIVASVLAAIGAETTMNDKAAAVIGTNANRQTWACINRAPSHFTVEVPCFIDEEYNWSDEQVAAAMGRSLADWLGTLICLGVEVMRKKPDLSFLTAGIQFKLLANSTHLHLLQERGVA